MLLAGYFDESIRNRQGEEPICVAGYLFKPRGYRHFKKKWARLLATGGPAPTSHFHMSSLYAADYEYAGWTVNQRAAYLRQAVEAVKKHAYGGISFMVRQAEFERLAPPNWAWVYGSLYSIACQAALRTTAFWLDERRNPARVAYFLESGQEFWHEANAMLAGIGGRPDLREAYRYHSHTPLDKKDAYGLQAADMHAWLMTRINVGVPLNHTMAHFAPHFMHLVDGWGERYQAFHPTGENLKRFFDENLHRTDDVMVVDLPKAKKGKLR
jgi:hypothetical protein